jgi:MFS family permease
MQRPDKKIFAVLFFSIFGAVLGVGIVVPLLPVYAHNLGSSGVYIGLIFGSFSLSRTFFLPFFGRQSDLRGRKPFIAAGLLAYAVISIAFIYSTRVEALIFVRFIQGIASAMIMPVTQAYIGDITPAGREGFVMGLFNMAMFAGLGFGPVMGGFINDSFGLNTTFLCMGGLTFLGFLLSCCLLPPTRSEHVVSSQAKPVAWTILLQDTQIIGLFGFRFAHAACIGIIWGFLPVMAASDFSMSSASIGILVTLGVLVSGAVHVPAGYFSDRVSKFLLMVIGGIIISFAVLFFQWSRGFWDMFWINVAFGIGGGISTPALMALAVIKGTRAGAMGSVMSLMTMAHSLGMLAGSLLAGWMMDVLQLRSVFPLGALLMGCGTVLMVVLFYRIRPVPQ